MAVTRRRRYHSQRRYAESRLRLAVEARREGTLVSADSELLSDPRSPLPSLSLRPLTSMVGIIRRPSLSGYAGDASFNIPSHAANARKRPDANAEI